MNFLLLNYEDHDNDNVGDEVQFWLGGFAAYHIKHKWTGFEPQK